MARFEKNDKIQLFRRKDVIRKGVIVDGPWNVEKVDHYHVKWDWVDYEDRLLIPEGKVELICDISSEKYHYELIN